ncbi:cyclic AMP-responsive element-binding protein 3 isoform 1-T1 [Molossus nigricans]
MSHMELALDPGEQDLLGFLLDESGDLRAVPEEVLEAPLDWELSLSEALSDWDVEDFLSSLPSPPAPLNILSNSNPSLVHHDHTYSLSQEYVSIDLDSGSCGKEGAQMTSPQVEEPSEQEIVRLILTDEEKRLLEQEGLSLPGTLPLTKMEEQVLKRVRRKIRNKKSAQESRRKKKVYVGGLESRVLKYTAQNLELQNKVQLLEEQNLSLLDQLRRLQAMVIQISNKTSSSSTCVLVRMVIEGEILLPGAGMGTIQSSSSFPFLVFQVLLFSFCLVFVPAMYSSGTRGSLPAESGGERLGDTIKGKLVGEAWPASEESFSPQYYPASFVLSLISWSCLSCSWRYQRIAQTMSSSLLATLASCSTTCLRLLAQSLLRSCHSLIPSQSSPPPVPFFPCMQISQEMGDGSLPTAPYLLSCRANTQARWEAWGLQSVSK